MAEPDSAVNARVRGRSLAEPWKPELGRERHVEELQILQDDRPRGLVPSQPEAPVVGMTAGVDTQDNGFCFVVRAWGYRTLESWLVREGFVDSFEGLASVLWERGYRDVHENLYVVNLTLIDSGGHRTGRCTTSRDSTRASARAATNNACQPCG